MRKAMEKKANLIVCYNSKMAIGLNNSLLYSIKEDLQRFKELTTDNVVIMGRKTYESIGSPLKDRINIIITSDKKFIANGCIVVDSLDMALAMCKQDFEDKEWFILGGAMIYKQCIDRGFVSHIYATEVMDAKEGDTYFPIFNNSFTTFLESDWEYIDGFEYPIRYVDYLVK